jgi:hypothetical protein
MNTIVTREVEVSTSSGFTITIRRDKDDSVVVSTHDKGVLPRMSSLDAMALGRAIQMVANALQVVEDERR